ncbi:MAG: hypothetical protein WCJ25_02450 [Candidatus Moraniibacteriota bacterium]
MKSIFSPELKEKPRAQYQMKTGEDLSDEKVEMILDRFGVYGEVVLKKIRDKRAREKVAELQTDDRLPSRG